MTTTNCIKIVLTNGDTAYADTAEDATYAASLMIAEAHLAPGQGYYAAKVTAAFYSPRVDGQRKLIRAGIKSIDLIGLT